MSKQALVIGLGQFGLSLCRALTRRGVEVTAVDSNPQRVQQVAHLVEHAVAFDATNEQELARLEPGRRDYAICAIGDESRDASIICTTLLRQMGVPRVLARATEPVHERILGLVGAHEVVNPERAFGERLAARLVHTNVIEQIPLGDHLAITEVGIPMPFVGRTLVELDLRRRFEVNVVAIRRTGENGGHKVVVPRGDVPLEAEDVLILVGGAEQVGLMLDRVS